MYASSRLALRLGLGLGLRLVLGLGLVHPSELALRWRVSTPRHLGPQNEEARELKERVQSLGVETRQHTGEDMALELPTNEQCERGDKDRQAHAVQLEEGHR